MIAVAQLPGQTSIPGLKAMTALLANVDPDGLLEYSVVYTDRALNHMSALYKGVVRDVGRLLRTAYAAHSVAIVPGSGTFAMEAVARQFVQGQPCLILRNGWFSYRWTQIIEMGHLTDRAEVLKARRTGTGVQAPFEPAPLEAVLAAIARIRPAVVFAPHVETSSGILLPSEYVRQVGEAVRAVGGLFVLDCIASGTVWVDMSAQCVDVLVSAPQKGWSGPPCCGFVAMNERARRRAGETKSSSFACDLLKWIQIMETYEQGGFAYHATPPTVALKGVRDAMLETERFGFARSAAEAQALGTDVRTLLARHGYPSVAADGFGAPGVVVSYTTRPEIQSGEAFAKLGLQVAAGVPLQCDEGEAFRSFRIGLFGLDKIGNRARTVNLLERALAGIAG
jgi:aspartate aminotransferase-like enzyme